MPRPITHITTPAASATAFMLLAERSASAATAPHLANGHSETASEASLEGFDTHSPGTPQVAAAHIAAADTDPDNTQTLPTLLARMLERAFTQLVGRFFLEALPFAQNDMFRAWQSLRDIHLADTSMRTKLRDVGCVLQDVSTALDSDAARTRAPARALKSYLLAILPWLDEIDALWAEIDIACLSPDASQGALQPALSLLQAIRTLADHKAMQPLREHPAAAAVLTATTKLHHLLGSICMLDKLPATASFDDCLSLMTGTTDGSNALAQVCAPILAALRQTCGVRCQGSDALPANQMAWMMEMLSLPRIQQQVRPHLEMMLGDSPSVDRLYAVIALSHAMLHRPEDGAPLEQARWLVQRARESGLCDLLPRGFWSGPGGGLAESASLAVLDAFLRVDQSEQAWPQLIGRLTEAACTHLPGMTEQAGPALVSGAIQCASWAGKGWLTPDVQLEVARFWRDSAPTESWSAMLQRLSESALRLTLAYAAAHCSGDPTTLATLYLAKELPRDLSWDGMLAWLLSQRADAHAPLASLYGHYTTVLIAWKVFDALQCPDLEASEAALRRLVRTLHDRDVVRSYPMLAKLIDVLPLIPVLRHVSADAAQHTPTQQPVTWYERALLWQAALLRADSPAARVAAQRLSHCLEGWLVQAAMSLCSLTVGPPGAQAAPLDASEAQSLPPVQAADAPLAAGSTLAVLGAACLMYGVWRSCRVPDTYAQVGTPAPAQPATARMRAVPFVLGGLALAAGGYLVHPYVQAWRAGMQQSGDASGTDGEITAWRQAYPDLAREIAALTLPEWGMLGSDTLDPNTLAQLARQSSAAMDRRNASASAGASPEQATAMPRKQRRSARPSIADTLAAFSANESNNAGARATLVLLQARCSTLDEVRKKTGEAREVALLIKLMQGVVEMAQDADYLAADRQRETQLTALWEVLYPCYVQALSSRHNDAVIEFGRLYQVKHALVFPPRLEPADLQRATDTLQAQVGPMTELLSLAYAPILDPARFIDQYIREGIAAYADATPHGESLTPDSPVRVLLRPNLLSNRNWRDHLDIDAVPRPVQETFTVKEIVTGQHHYRIDDKRENDFTFSLHDTSHEALLATLKSDGLQSAMTAAFSTYRGDSARTEALRQFHHAMITQRCLAYLEKKDRFPLFADAVERFLADGQTARLLLFRDQVVNGAFCIPVHGKTFLILSIDQPLFFHVFERTYMYLDPVPKTGVISTFPDTREFRDWVYNKIPVQHAMRYPKQRKSLDYQFRSFSEPFSDPSQPEVSRLYYVNMLVAEPLTLSGEVERASLGKALADHFLDRVDSDIDTLVLTDRERVTLRILSVIKGALQVVGLGVSAMFPGTGTLLAMVCRFMILVGIDIVSVGTSTLQSWIADRPQDIDSYAHDAVLGTVFLCANLPAGFKVATGAADRVLTVENLRQSRRLYRSLKAQITQRYRPTPAAAAGVSAARQPSGRGDLFSSQAGGQPAKLVEHAMSPSLSRDSLARFYYSPSPNFRAFDMAVTPGRERVGYRTIPKTGYVHIYTQPESGLPTYHSTDLIVSAHGGYFKDDVFKPAVPIPTDIAVQMLNPHTTSLFDPTVDKVMNDPNFKAYLRVEGKLQQVSFIPQRHAEWFFSNKFDPTHPYATLGAPGGLMNYRHTAYEENPWQLWSALMANRRAAPMRQVKQADILVVNAGEVGHLGTVLDLARQGVLVNAHGESFKTITFVHCRVNLDAPPILESSYDAIGDRVAAIKASRPSRTWAVYITSFNTGQGVEDLTARTTLAGVYCCYDAKQTPGAKQTPTVMPDRSTT